MVKFEEGEGKLESVSLLTEEREHNPSIGLRDLLCLYWECALSSSVSFSNSSIFSFKSHLNAKAVSSKLMSMAISKIKNIDFDRIELVVNEFEEYESDQFDAI